MDHDTFTGQVQARARLDSSGAALSATRATLETLRERLAGGLPGNLAAQLPPEIGRYLDEEGAGEQFGVKEFYERVAERAGAGADMPQAAFQARVVLSVVAEAVSGGFDRLEGQLPDEYRELFDFSDIEAVS